MAETQINIADMATNLLNETTRGAKSLKHINIIIAGKTGVGKSSLINAAFRDKLADVGVGRPQTQETELIEKEDMPLRIYDTVGLELTESTKQGTIDDIHRLIEEKQNTGDEDQYIHIVWYCVMSESARFEEPEQELIEDIAKMNVPVILVLTKAFRPKQAEAFAKKIQDFHPRVEGIIPVLAQKDEFSDDDVYGIDELSEKTLNILVNKGRITEEQRISLVNVLTSIKIKHKEATQAIKKYVVAAVAAAATPVAFLADAAMLIPLQITMMAQITLIYGAKYSKSELVRILISLLSVSGTTIAGRFVATSLIKMIPGAGSVAGGAISAATAGILTYALGQTYIYIMDAMLRGELDYDSLDDKGTMSVIGNIMKEYLSEPKDKILNWSSNDDNLKLDEPKISTSLPKPNNTSNNPQNNIKEPESTGFLTKVKSFLPKF